MNQKMVAAAREDGSPLRLIDGAKARHACRHGEAEILLHQNLAAKAGAGLLQPLLHRLECAVVAIALENPQREGAMWVGQPFEPGEIAVEISAGRFHRREDKHRSVE